MPERIAKITESAWWEPMFQMALLAWVGVLIAVGQLLLSPERQPLRVWIGRSISTGGLAMGAGSALLWIPGLPLQGLIGLAAMLATLGTAGLERLFKKVLEKR